MSKKYRIDTKPRKSGTGKFFLGLFLGMVMCVASLIGFGWFTYENISVKWLNDTFNIGLDLGTQELNNKTIKEVVANARNLAEKINTYSLNDLNKDFGISLGDKVMGIDINDLKDVPIKDLSEAAEEKLNCISVDELKDVVDISDLDLILNKTYTFYVSGDKLYEDSTCAPDKEVDKNVIKYTLTSTQVTIKEQTRTIQDNKVEFEFRFLPLTKAVGYLKNTIGDKITIGDLIDDQKGFGVNLPAYLCDTAEKRAKTINQLEDAIDDLTLAEFLGYTISGNDVYNGGKKVTGIVAKLAKKTVAELKDVETIINTSTVAEIFDYSYEGRKYYYMNNGVKTEVTGIMKVLATTKVQELTKTISDMSVLTALEYVAYTKADGSTGYKDASGREVTGALTILDLQNTKITEIATKLQTAIEGKTLFELAAAGVINVSTDDLEKMIPDDIESDCAGFMLGELYINQAVEVLIALL